MIRRRPRPLPTVVLAGGLVMLAGGCAGDRLGPPSGGTRQSRYTHDLWNGFLLTGLVVLVIVYGLIFWVVLRYRQRRHDDGRLPRQTRYNIPLEIVYTAIPLLMVFVLFGFTLHAQLHIDKVADAAPARVVRIEGFQWGWKFVYVNDGATVLGGSTTERPELALPVDQNVRLQITGLDVIHSFFVPGFLYKRDAIPGRVNEVDLRPTKVATYGGHCSEFCGLYHSQMNFVVNVMNQSDFDRWLATHRTPSS